MAEKEPLIDLRIKVRSFGVRKMLRKYVLGSDSSSSSSSETAIRDISSSTLASLTPSEEIKAIGYSSSTPSEEIKAIGYSSSTPSLLETTIEDGPSLLEITSADHSPSSSSLSDTISSDIPSSLLETTSSDTPSVLETTSTDNPSALLETTSTDIPSSSPPSLPLPLPPPSRNFKYDVFLSFRGTDTRKNFADHLYAALKRKSIYTFRDDEELVRGEDIAPNLLKAIEKSRYAVVVLSPSYADSSFCLHEIAHIMKCSRETGITVLPIFYGEDPSNVRRQTGNRFVEAFKKHEKRYSGEQLQIWKDALRDVSNLSGWDLQNGYESQMIEKVVDKIFRESNKNLISESNKDLVGMRERMDNIIGTLNIQNTDVRIIGISGMGGIGKTTLAQVVFESSKCEFEGDCFLRDVREVAKKKAGVDLLYQKLLSKLLDCDVNVEYSKAGKDMIMHRLSCKKVLIILDDVDQMEQLEALSRREFYGPGSRIFITSRDDGLLTRFGVDEIRKVDGLNDAEALELFSLKAFKGSEVQEDCRELANQIVKYADGLPLAIEVLGSSLRGRDKKFWSSKLEKLKKYPDQKIKSVLLVGYDELDETQQQLFLDIACFFKGEKIDRVKRIVQADWDCDVQTLSDKSLIFLYEDKLGMHDLIQEVGWDIARQEHPNEPGKHKRLWRPEEIIKVLDRRKATSKVESILLQCPTKDDNEHSVDDAFSQMSRLRLLKIWNVKFSGNVDYLSDELQSFEWHECPFESFPPKFQPDNLVELRMISSCIKNLWTGVKGWKRLRHIDLSDSQYLKSTPDFTDVSDLETLVLKDCTSLVEVHPSLGLLKKLVSLNMKNCKSVKSIPRLTGLESLQTLNLALCSRLEKFPETEGNMESLQELYLDGTSIEELPKSVERLTGLTTLNLTHCKNLLRVSSTILRLSSLKSLHLTGCSKFDENLNCVKTLEELYIGGTGIRDVSFLVGMKNLKILSCRGCKGGARSSLKLPASFSSLISLRELDLSYCNLNDGAIPDDLFSLASLKMLDLTGNWFSRLPERICPDSKLENLILRKCRKLEMVPKKLPQSLQYVYAQDCTSLKDYPNKIISVPSSGGKLTTINSLINSSALGDSSLGRSLELVLSYSDTENRVDGLDSKQNEDLKQVELLLSLSDPLYRTHNKTEIPEWFSNKSTSNPIWIPTGNQEWKGVAACAVFAVDEGHSSTTADSEFSNYLYQITLETDIVRLEPYVIIWDEQLRPSRSSSHLLLICYEPSSKFPTWGLNKSTVVRAIFETNNPYMVVKKCGIRLVYEKDAGWYCSKICPELNLVHLNEGDECCVAASGWFIAPEDQKGKWKWEKMIPTSSGEDSDELALRKNIESILPQYLQAIRHCSPVFEFQLLSFAIPCRFQFLDSIHDEHGVSYKIEMPKDLHKRETWMGIALCASVSIAEQEKKEETDSSYSVNFRFSSKEGECHKTLPTPQLKLNGKLNRVLILYLPRAEIPASLFTDTDEMRVFVKTDCSLVALEVVSNSLVYQEDIQELAEIIIQGMQRDSESTENSFKCYNEMVEKDWKELIRVQGKPEQRRYKTRRKLMVEGFSKTFESRDWSTLVPIYCDFIGVEISKWTWFSKHIKQGSSAEIPLPTDLFGDENWLGIAVCAFSSISGGPHLEHNVVSCRLDADVPSKGSLDLTYHAPLKWYFAHDMTWFFYIPRAGKSSIKSWRQCKQARATLSSSLPTRLQVQSCALRLVYKKDVKDLGQTLTSCELL